MHDDLRKHAQKNTRKNNETRQESFKGKRAAANEEPSANATKESAELQQSANEQQEVDSLISSTSSSIDTVAGGKSASGEDKVS